MKITAEQERRLREEVREEFPDDEMMQEIHFVRLIHYLQTKDLTPEEQINFYRQPDRVGPDMRNKQ